MNALADRDFCAALVLSLGHFLWQGTLIAGLAMLVTRRVASSHQRYRRFVAALTLMALCPVVTLAIHVARIEPLTSPIAARTAETAAPLGDNLAKQMPSTVDSTASTVLPPRNASANPATSPIVSPVEPSELAIASGWHRFAPLLMNVYLLGVAVMLLRLVVGLWGGWRLRLRSFPVEDAALLHALRRQANSLGMRFVPLLAYCERVAVPTVIGILKPTILLPLSLTSGLAPQQVEAVLAHELAHLRRFDHLVNLVQRMIESVLFFHPAVWWLSSRIRVEREHCCDDLVVACGAVPLDYAKSLLRVAELSRNSRRMNRSVSAVSLLATGQPSKLRQRIARLLGDSTDTQVRFLHRWPAILLSMLCLFMAWTTTRVGWSLSDVPAERPDKYIATLPGNIEVEILGVGFHPSQEREWWKVDGTKLDKRPREKRPGEVNTVYDGDPSKQADCREFAVEVRGLPREHSVKVDLGPVAHAGGMTEEQGVWMSNDAAGPFKDPTTTIRIGLTTEPFGPIVAIDTEGRKQTQAGLPREFEEFYAHLAPLGVAESDGQIQLLLDATQWNLLWKTSAGEIHAIDKDGTRIRSSTTELPASGPLRLGFKVPLSKLARFEYRLRPYRQWVTFENVSLKPGVKTDVKVTTKYDQLAVTLPNGARVELLGVGYHKWSRRDWWGADGGLLDGVPQDPKLKQNDFTHITAGPRQGECREFAVRITGLPKGEKIFGWQFLYEPYGDAVSNGVIYEPSEFHIAELPPISSHNVKTATLRICMDQLPEELVRSFGVDGKKLGATPANAALRSADDLIQPLRVETANGQSELILKEFSRKGDTPFVEYVPEAIDVDGGRHGSIRAGGRKGVFAYLYPIPRERIARFEYRMTLYRNWVTFENISLEPGNKTEPTVSVGSLPEEKLAATKPPVKQETARTEGTPVTTGKDLPATEALVLNLGFVEPGDRKRTQSAIYAPQELVLNLGFERDDSGEIKSDKPVLLTKDGAMPAGTFRTHLEGLRDSLRTKQGNQGIGQTIVVLRADKEVPFDAVQGLIQTCREIGFSQFTLSGIASRDGQKPSIPDLMLYLSLPRHENGGVKSDKPVLYFNDGLSPFDSLLPNLETLKVENQLKHGVDPQKLLQARRVTIRADHDVPYAAIDEVVKVCAEMGFTKLSFAPPKPVTLRPEGELANPKASKLEQKVSLRFRREPLHSALEVICQAAKCSLVLDGDGLKSLGYTKNMPVSIQADGLTLRDGLKLVLKPYEQHLAFMVDQDVVFVGNKQQVEAREKARDQALAAIPKGLEFLAPYPKLRGLSLKMTEKEFQAIAEQHQMKLLTSNSDGGRTSYYVSTGDGHTVIVMFTNGECNGIQRLRGEFDINPPDEANKPVNKNEEMIEAIGTKVIAVASGKVFSTDANTKYVRLNGKDEEAVERTELHEGDRIRLEFAPPPGWSPANTEKEGNRIRLEFAPSGKKISKVIIVTASKEDTPKDGVKPAPGAGGGDKSATAWGPANNGLRARIIPVSATMDEDAIDPAKRVQQFAKADDVAFVVELENVSDKPIKLLDTRYGDGYGESKGKAKSDWYGQFLFSMDYFAPDGKLIPQPEVQVVDLDNPLGGAFVAVLEPAKTHRFLLRPASWLGIMRSRLEPGRHHAAIRYHGLPARVAERLKEYRPQSTVLDAVAGDIVSPITTFEISEDPEPPIRPKLVWGDPTNGLRAAMEFVPGQAIYHHGEKPDVSLHVQNVSEKPIIFPSHLWLSGISASVKNNKGEPVELDGTDYSGWTLSGRITLQPRQIAVFDAGNIGLAETKEQADKFEHMTHRKLVAPIGKYTMQLGERFGQSFLLKDGQGKQLAPLEGDWKGELTTGATPLVIAKPAESEAK